MNLKVKDILNITNGTLIIGDKEKECKNFSKDTRNIKKLDTYIGLKGENLDGSLFWKDAFDKGADVVIINEIKLDKEDVEKYKNQKKVIIEVKDTIIALAQIATLKRELYGDKIKVIGVTGSVGKTSTKDIIANVLSKKYKTLKTEGNNNNHIGLPFTILRLQDEEVAVIEMGMNHLNEISYLSKIARPDISVITNIGTSHIGNLGSRENILKAKLEILDGMEKKRIIINNDNDLLNKWNLENKENIEVYTYGIDNKSDVEAKELVLNENSSSFRCTTKYDSFFASIPEAGKHFVLNALCAVSVGKLLGLDNNQLQQGLEDFKLTSKRMEITKLNNDITIINDSYNASYESMKAAILTLKNMKGKRKIAILGDMLELGDFAQNLHIKVGEEIATNKIDKLYLIGEMSNYIAIGAEKLGFNKNNIFFFKDKGKLVEKLNNDLCSGDIALFKASNGMKLFEVAEDIILKESVNI